MGAAQSILAHAKQDGLQITLADGDKIAFTGPPEVRAKWREPCRKWKAEIIALLLAQAAKEKNEPGCEAGADVVTGADRRGDEASVAIRPVVQYDERAPFCDLSCPWRHVFTSGRNADGSREEKPVCVNPQAPWIRDDGWRWLDSLDDCPAKAIGAAILAREYGIKV